MRICFLFFGPQEEKIAQVMIASVRQHMPNAIITQLTDATTRRVKGVDECRRLNGVTYGYLMMSHMATCPLPFIRVDYDMIFQGDITTCLEGDGFDMAFNGHGDEKVLASTFGKKYPIAACVWGAKGHQFAIDMRKLHIASGRDDWLGVIPSTNETAQNYRIKLLPGFTWNYCPKNREDKPKDALVIHYKGRRKQWMLAPEDAHLAIPDQERIIKRVQQYKNPEEFALPIQDAVG